MFVFWHVFISFNLFVFVFSFEMDIWWSLMFSFTHIICTHISRSMFVTMLQFWWRRKKNDRLKHESWWYWFCFCSRWCLFWFSYCRFLSLSLFLHFYFIQSHIVCTAHGIVYTCFQTHIQWTYELDQWITYHVIIMLSKILTSQLSEAWNVWIYF